MSFLPRVTALWPTACHSIRLLLFQIRISIDGMPPARRARVLLACWLVYSKPSAAATVSRTSQYWCPRLPKAAPTLESLYLGAYLGPFFEEAFQRMDRLILHREGLSQKGINGREDAQKHPPSLASSRKNIGWTKKLFKRVSVWRSMMMRSMYVQVIKCHHCCYPAKLFFVNFV